MIGTIILIVLLVIGVGILGWIFFKTLPQLRMLDPSTSRDTKSRALKYEIMRQRVERAGGKHIEKVHKNVIHPIGKGFQDAVRTFAGKLTAVERKYQERRKQTGESTLTKEQLAQFVEEGKRLMDEEMWDRAEKKFIEVISNDPKHVDAYEYLGRLYQYKKDFKLAKQTFQFLNKLSPENASVIASLGEVEEKLNNPEKAHKYFAQAVELSPKNPKYLDFFIESAIDLGHRDEAWEGLEKLRGANPENQKIDEFAAQIKDMPKK